MAKKRKNGKNRVESSKPLTSKRYMKERARNLPLDKCYVTEKWQEVGIAVVIVTRRRKDGDLCIGLFLVDTYCLGVKDAIYNVDVSEFEVKSIIQQHNEQGNPMREAPYEEVHNLILGAVEFAADAGIEPHKDYDIASGILEEDTDDIPLISYEYGCDGKYLLVDTTGTHRHLIHDLKKRLGDKFEYVCSLDDYGYDMEDDYDADDYKKGYEDDEFDVDEAYERIRNEYRQKFEAEGLDFDEFLKTMCEGMEAAEENRKKYPWEPYHCDHPQYPDVLEISHPEIKDFLFSDFEPKKEFQQNIKSILKLSADDVLKDVSNSIYFVLGRVHKFFHDSFIIDKGLPTEFDPVLYKAVLVFSELKHKEAFDVLILLLRQRYWLLDHFLGPYSLDLLSEALYLSDNDQEDRIKTLLNEPGLTFNNRTILTDYLLKVGFNQKRKKKKEIIAFFREYLKQLKDRLPSRNACDGRFVGCLCSDLFDMGLTELMPEMEELFETGLIDPVGCNIDNIRENADKSADPEMIKRMTVVGRLGSRLDKFEYAETMPPQEDM